MEDELWREVYRLAKRISKGKAVVGGTYPDAIVVAVYFWAVVHDRTNRWACDKKNWHGCGPRGKLPSAPTMSRRLRTKSVIELIESIENELIGMNRPSLCRLIDAKPLPVSPHSEDPDAAYGRASSSMARGYKFHAIYDDSQGFIDWSIKPMNVNECPAGAELISRLTCEGYLIGDNAYDRNKLYALAGERGVQLIAPQRKQTKGIGNQKHSPFRLVAIEMQTRRFARDMVFYRRMIETAFAQLTTLSFGLGPLPSWVRTMKKVRIWVRAKLILFNLYRLKQKTYVI